MDALQSEIGKLFAAYFDPDKAAVRLKQEVFPIVSKPSEYGRPNGLVQDGPYRGYWAHKIGAGSWLLARPNVTTRAGVIAARHVSSCPDLKMWTATLDRLQRGFSKGILVPGVTYDFTNYFSQK